MLPKKHRIVRTAFAQAAYTHAVHGESFSFKVAKTDALKQKFSVVVSKKVASHAVDRNKIRRRAYRVLQKLLPRLTSGIQGVFMAKNGAGTKTFSDLEQDMTVLLIKIGILK